MKTYKIAINGLVYEVIVEEPKENEETLAPEAQYIEQ
jgi:hypothetical protein